MYLTFDELAARGVAVDATRADRMIADVEARAVLVAPCLATPGALTELQRAAVVAILADVVDRKAQKVQAGATTTSRTAGRYTESVTVSTDGGDSRVLFWPSEIDGLQDICAAVTAVAEVRGAFSIAPSYQTDPGGFYPMQRRWSSV